MLAVFLFTKGLQQYAILRIKPVRSQFHFSALSHGDYVLWAAKLWFCDVGILQKNYFGKLDTRRKKEGRKDLKGVVCRCPSSSSVIIRHL